LDKDDLEVRLDAKEGGEPDPKEREKMPLEKKQIRRILPLKSDHHVLLVTLLLLNSAANEMLPSIWLDRIVPQWAVSRVPRRMACSECGRRGRATCRWCWFWPVRANLCAVGILICPGVDVPSARTSGLHLKTKPP
jgi:hypothetical protein